MAPSENELDTPDLDEQIPRKTQSTDKSQENLKNMRLLTNKQIELITENFPTKTSPGPDGFNGW